jgi:hypothetical protein
MNLTMTIGAQDYALIQFFLHFFPRARVSFLRYSEVLFFIAVMVEFHSLRALIISAYRAPAAFVFHSHQSYLLSF